MSQLSPPPARLQQSEPLPTAAPGVPPRKRSGGYVSFGEKLALGCGGITMFFGNVSVKAIAVPVYQMTLGVNPALLGLAMALPRLWDAITDPVMGSISDNCRSRFGRRRPFIVVGALLMGLSFGLIWMVPPSWSENAQLIYFVLTSLLFFTCFTVFSVPYNSLTYEMTPDYHERTRVMAYPTFFSKIAEAGYTWVIPLAGLAIFGGFLAGMRWVGWGVALIVMAGIGMLPGLLVRERFVRPDQDGDGEPESRISNKDRVRFFPTLLQSLRSRAFVILIVLTILQVIAGMLASSLDYYLLVYHMFDGDIEDGSYWKAILSTGYAVVGFASVFGVGWLANRLDKRTVLAFIYATVAAGGIVKWFVFQPGHSPWWILLDPLFCGSIYVAIGMVMPSMLADICDEDELQSGQRREGMYGAIFSWISKTGVSLAFFGSGVALVLVGFNEQLGGNQDPRAILLMRLILAGSVMVTSAISAVLLLFYPITERTADLTRQQLEARRGIAA